MNHRKSLLFLAGIAVLLLAAFWTGSAYATTGCFPDTNGHWAETFICWLKDNGLTAGYGDGTYRPNNGVTRAEMSVFLQKIFNLADTSAKAYADSLVNVPPTSGQLLIAAGANNYVPLSATSTLSMTYYSNRLQVTKPATGSEWIGITPDMPVVLYGKSLQLMGIELCYKASTTAFLSIVDVKTILDSTSVGNYTTSFYDTTDYKDHTCRYFVLTTPLTLQSDHASVAFYILIQWTVANDPFELSRTTFVFQPTGVEATPLASGPSGMEISILQEGIPPEGDSTTGR